MAATALAIYSMFAVLALVWRGWLQYRRTGDHGIRGFSGRVGSVEWWSGSLLTLGVIAGFLALVAEIWSGVPLLRIVLPAAIRITGLALMALGTLLTLVAQLEMGSSWRVGVDSSEVTGLVTTGLFRWVRNPIFAAMLTVFLGLALAVPNLIAGLSLIAVTAGLEIQVRVVEEPHLVHVHGARYLAYAQRVGRFVPGFGRIP